MTNYVKAFIESFNKPAKSDDPEPIISPAAAARIRDRMDAAVPAIILTRAALNMLAIGIEAEIPVELLEKAQLDGWFGDQLAQELKNSTGE